MVEQLPVSGARLYTETRGAGPLLLFVVGGNGDPAVFSRVAGRLAAVAEKIVPAGGRDSREKGNMPFLPVVTLAGRLGCDIAEFPGGHVGYAEHPDDFATQLGRLLGADR